MKGRHIFWITVFYSIHAAIFIHLPKIYGWENVLIGVGIFACIWSLFGLIILATEDMDIPFVLIISPLLSVTIGVIYLIYILGQIIGKLINKINNAADEWFN